MFTAPRLANKLFKINKTQTIYCNHTTNRNTQQVWKKMVEYYTQSTTAKSESNKICLYLITTIINNGK